jgi:hypothetical protein
MSGAYKYRPQYTQNELGVLPLPDGRPLNERPEAKPTKYKAIVTIDGIDYEISLVIKKA